jgi:hypothetical protein
MAKCGGGRPTVESSITLDIRHLMRAGLAPGRSQSGTLQWTWANSRLACHAVFNTCVDEDTGLLHLASITCFDLFGGPVYLRGQTTRLVASAPPFGGRRWWFVCPHTSQRVMKLHLPRGGQGFASRQAYGLDYAVQRLAAGDQARRRARKARARIGGSSNLLEKLPPKPKWMRWATYWRHVEACHQVEREMLKFLVADGEKILGRRISP